MNEFEYSFVVTSATPYHSFCTQHSKEGKQTTHMQRTVYKNDSTIIARTTTEVNAAGLKQFYYDFKDDSKDTALIKNVRESGKIIVEESKQAAVEKLLERMGYAPATKLIKQRVSYRIGTVQVDIDTYTSPKQAIVVELEGEPNPTKRLYTKMMRYIDNIDHQ